AAVHVDSGDAGTEVAAAAAALAAADGGDEKAQAAVDAAEEHDLLWFATQEIAGLVAAREDS
ncbi:hypothetical protein G3I51_23565, partial [Streptomyces sp. SID9944]|nr:hypothetical protein [Streptomyces sp. SID9944]